jgi:hypothetical protein
MNRHARMRLCSAEARKQISGFAWITHTSEKDQLSLPVGGGRRAPEVRIRVLVLAKGLRLCLRDSSCVSLMPGAKV